jgi:hypothetical protein
VASSSPGPSSCPYSPECLEGEFTEVRTGLRQVASCLGWKGMPLPEKGVGKDKASCRILCP